MRHRFGIKAVSKSKTLISSGHEAYGSVFIPGPRLLNCKITTELLSQGNALHIPEVKIYIGVARHGRYRQGK